ncbi:folate-binding protein YgfZ [Terrihabitans rhizophilus]|uniref:Folate-binding protein YgfZ n=1 Tax=Terrihabitans rhizophilus TaxID=3092662 RepID=A0ABU4RR87_9HYPH|nr:folate-binding protein YgfZ [Terrihabitans sp. PJ23]MDX6807367.1 folate-binding protein YgfZ [Terrihabitans sp. PJ23]
MKAAILTDRSVLRIQGPEAPHFLNNLVTSSVGTLEPGNARYSALLTPQGKIIADFFVVGQADGFLLDVRAGQAEELRKRLMLYKLRAKVTLTIEDLAVVSLFGGEAPPVLTMTFADPRLSALGWRAIMAPDDLHLLAEHEVEQVSEAEYHAHRIGLGVPEGGKDFAFGDAFPHEADMDQFGGVDFRKGCYIGQEIVSRMQHRGTARTRIVPVAITGPAEPGSEITAGERSLGKLGSVSGTQGLATLRLDRAEDVLNAGEPIRAGEASLTLQRPSWAQFRFPGDPLPEAAQ